MSDTTAPTAPTAPRRPRILLTGFEPFGGESVNPSAEVVAAIEADPPSGIDLDTLIIEVRRGVGLEVLAPRIEAGGYDAWLGLGQAGGRPALSVERVGINVLITRDLETAAAAERAIVEGGPAAYFSQLPVLELAEHITAAGAPAVVSNTAGTYICNEVTYAVQHHLAITEARPMASGFIHLPFLPQQPPSGIPSLPLDVQVEGIRAALAFVAGLVPSSTAAVEATEAART